MRSVVTRSAGRNQRAVHDRATCENLALRLAGFLGLAYAGEYDPRGDYAQRPYVVPADALTAKEANALRIRGPKDFFGGVVPHRFVASKAITHRLIEPGARAPRGWSTAFADEVASAVLPGYTAFTADDSLHAGTQLLKLGPVRLKEASGIGGGGQRVVSTPAELRKAIAALDPEVLASTGIVVEANLVDAKTYSVGQVEAGGIRATYWGVQRTTRNARGKEVYGGSTIRVVRGDFAELLKHRLAPAARRAVKLAHVYDAAARSSFTGFFASRRNYDVAHGKDAAGRWRMGVLEQSWRIGGASGAEILALEIFGGEPGCDACTVSTVERYGPAAIPAGAFVYFRGSDPRTGPLTKYAIAGSNGDAR